MNLRLMKNNNKEFKNSIGSMEFKNDKIEKQSINRRNELIEIKK